jgi:hypothetical protein
MNRTLQRRIELLETRSVPTCEPLRIVVTSIPSDYILSADERVVEDEFPEDECQPCPLMLTVNERITTDPGDHGNRWSDRT